MTSYKCVYDDYDDDYYYYDYCYYLPNIAVKGSRVYDACHCLCVCSQVVHLAIQAFVCLAMMHLLRPGIMEKAVFVWAMGYLCFGHIYRMYYDYGGYTLDITGSVK